MTAIVLVFLWKHYRTAPYHSVGKDAPPPAREYPFIPHSNTRDTYFPAVNIYPQVDPYVTQAELPPRPSFTASNPQYKGAGVRMDPGQRVRPSYPSKFANPQTAGSGLPSTPSSSPNAQSTQGPSSIIFTDIRDNGGATAESSATGPTPTSPIGVPPAYSQSFRA
jgi:hypothetical protein